MSNKLNILLYDISNVRIEEINITRPKTYKELISTIKTQFKKLPKYFLILGKSEKNEEFEIHTNEEYQLANNTLFVREFKIKLGESLFTRNFNELSESQKDSLSDKYSCSICYQLIKGENPAFCYECQKIFHNDCLHCWDDARKQAYRNLTCPNCRNELPLDKWQKKIGYDEMRNNDIEIVKQNIKSFKDNKFIKAYNTKLISLLKSVMIKVNELNSYVNYSQKDNKIKKMDNNLNLLLNKDISKATIEKLDNIKNFIKKTFRSEIRCTLDVTDINTDIILFTFNEDNKNKTIEAFCQNNKLNTIIIEDHCKIKSNSFKKKGKYEIKLYLDDTMNNLKNLFKKSEICSVDFSYFVGKNIKDISKMFSYCKKLKEIKGLNKLDTSRVTNMESLFLSCNELEYLDLSGFDTSNVETIHEMFCQCKKLKEIKGLNNFNTSKVTNMGSLFGFCNELEYLDLSSFDTSNVTDISRMFSLCGKLKEIKGLNKFNTSKVTDMYALFSMCSQFECIDVSNFDTSNVKTIGFMFDSCSNLKEIKGLNNFNTTKATSMDGLFQSCQNLEYLDLSSFDTSNVRNMGIMFSGCYKLKEIKGINNFNTSKVTNMEFLFQTCENLEYLDLSNFNTANVKNMNNMFFHCEKLKEIKGINKFNTSKVTNMGGMFWSCINLESIDLSNFNTSNVKNMENMFNDCTKLKEIKGINQFNISNVTKMENIFKNCNQS